MMQTLLLAAPVLLAGMTAIYLVFFVLLLRLFRKETEHRILLLMAGLAFGLLYDALILTLGAFLGDSRVLKTLSYPRYILHGALTPLLLSICAEALDADRTIVRIVGTVTAFLMIAGAVAGCKIKLRSLAHAGITRYISDPDRSPAWADRLLHLMSIVPTLALIAAGLVLWKKRGNKELALGGLTMFVCSAIGPATGHLEESFLFSMFGELGMLINFWIHAKKTIEP